MTELITAGELAAIKEAAAKYGLLLRHSTKEYADGHRKYHFDHPNTTFGYASSIRTGANAGFAFRSVSLRNSNRTDFWLPRKTAQARIARLRRGTSIARFDSVRLRLPNRVPDRVRLHPTASSRPNATLGGDSSKQCNHAPDIRRIGPPNRAHGARRRRTRRG
jgi:hypothetical protein